MTAKLIPSECAENPCRQANPYSSLGINSHFGLHLFVFVNRKRTFIKVLYFDRSGYCIWSKRLERGRFHYRTSVDHKVALDWTALKLMLEGISLKDARRRKRYLHFPRS